MKTTDFNYDLPPELIAQEPLPERSASRMLVLRRSDGHIEHKHVSDLPQYLRRGDLLVLNDTKVILARVFGKRADTGGKVELLLVNETERQSLNTEHRTLDTSTDWTALHKAAGKLKVGAMLSLAGGRLRGEIVNVGDQGKVTVRLSGDRPVMEILEEEGVPPVPPYIRRSGDSRSLVDVDRTRYQTVYAKHPGAIAAPTAGLHFTPELLGELESAGIARTAVTLHVGLGTFRPVKSERVEDHVMEEERYTVSEDAAEKIRGAKAGGGRIVAVGTTSVRTLETVAREHGTVVPSSGRSSLFAYPPFEFKVVDCLLTNFHLPMSTLLMLVSAFAQKEVVLRVYKEAINLKYRFYSYGDCMLFL